MAKQTINTGTSNDAGNGDNLRTAFTKINENFSELYTLTGSSNTAALKDIKGSVFADDSTVMVDSVNGTLNGDLTGDVTGNVTGNLTGNVTSTTGTSSFANLTVSSTLDLTGATVSSDVNFGTNDLTGINNLTIGGSLLTNAMSPLLATGGNGQNLSLAGGQSTAGDGGDAILNAGAGTGSNGDVQIGSSNTANIVIGDGTNTVDYPSGTSVDFTGATVTGLASHTETDPVVGAITGIVKADGSGNISAAVAGTDYLTTVAFSDLTGTPTTLAGYGITDATSNNNPAFTGAVDFTGTTSVDFTGTTVTGLTVTGDVTGSVFADNSTVLVDGVAGTINSSALTKPIALADNEKIIFGSDNDLEIFHNASNGNTIIENNTGNLVIKGSNLFLQSASSEYFFRGAANGAVTLYYDNVAKFETTTDGVAITGKITGLTDPTAAQDAATKAYVDANSGGGGGLADVVSDTTPQLGGDLDVNGNSIVSVSDGDINLAPNGAGEVTVTGNATISNVAKAYEFIVTNANGALKFGDNTGSEGYMNIYLNNVAGGARHVIQSYPTAGGGFKIQNNVNDQAITFETKDSGGTTQTPLTLNGDGSVAVGGIQIKQGVEEKFATTNGATGVTALDCSTGHVHYLTAPAGDITANFTNLGLTAEYATNVTVIIDQGNTEYEITAVQIGGAAQTIVWQGNSAPTGTANGVDSFSFTILNDGGTYVVLGQMVAFGGV
jgi:hypothetical protein